MFKGRINRTTYLAGFIASLIPFFALTSLVFKFSSEVTIQKIFLFIIIFLLSAFNIWISIKRCHDLGRSGSFILHFWRGSVGARLFLEPGKKEINKFGPAPLPGIHF